MLDTCVERLVGRVAVVVLSVALVACGGGDGEEPDSPPTATPLPAIATVTPQPTPVATRAPAFDEVVLGVGWEMPVVNEDGIRPVRPMILRNDGTAWTAERRWRAPAGVALCPMWRFATRRSGIVPIAHIVIH